MNIPSREDTVVLSVYFLVDEQALKLVFSDINASY